MHNFCQKPYELTIIKNEKVWKNKLRLYSPSPTPVFYTYIQHIPNNRGSVSLPTASGSCKTKGDDCILQVFAGCVTKRNQRIICFIYLDVSERDRNCQVCVFSKLWRCVQQFVEAGWGMRREEVDCFTVKLALSYNISAVSRITASLQTVNEK